MLFTYDPSTTLRMSELHQADVRAAVSARPSRRWGQRPAGQLTVLQAQPTQSRLPALRRRLAHHSVSV